MIQTMREYPPEMYQEILKDYNWRYGKFSPIPYPLLTAIPPNPQKQNDNN